MRRPYQSRYDAIVDPFQTLPDGLDDPYMLLYAFTRLALSGESANAGGKRTTIGTGRIRATSKVRMLANVALTALNLNGSSVARSPGK